MRENRLDLRRNEDILYQGSLLESAIVVQQLTRDTYDETGFTSTVVSTYCYPDSSHGARSMLDLSDIFPASHSIRAAAMTQTQAHCRAAFVNEQKGRADQLAMPRM